MRLLLVEDELEMAPWLMRALAQSGFVPDHAPDARSAEALMSANAYDAIAMDLRLPDKHGLVLLREMRNRNATVRRCCCDGARGSARSGTGLELRCRRFSDQAFRFGRARGVPNGFGAVQP